jgi:hypothetical protein
LWFLGESELCNQLKSNHAKIADNPLSFPAATLASGCRSGIVSDNEVSLFIKTTALLTGYRRKIKINPTNIKHSV